MAHLKKTRYAVIEHVEVGNRILLFFIAFATPRFRKSRSSLSRNRTRRTRTSSSTKWSTPRSWSRLLLFLFLYWPVGRVSNQHWALWRLTTSFLTKAVPKNLNQIAQCRATVLFYNLLVSSIKDLKLSRLFMFIEVTCFKGDYRSFISFILLMYERTVAKSFP